MTDRIVTGVDKWLILPALLLAAGCSSSISFVAETSVNAKGEVTRTTELASSGSQSFDELQRKYQLLPGGEWAESTSVEPAAPFAGTRRVYNRIYRLTRSLDPNQAIEADFRRHGGTGDGVAENEIDIRVERLWFVETYSYSETFSDIVTREKSFATARELFDTYMNILAVDLAAELRSDRPVPDVLSRLREHFEPDLERLLEVVDEHCFQPGSTMESCEFGLELSGRLESFVGLFSGHQKLAAAIVDLFPAPEGVDSGDWLNTIEYQVVRPAENRLDEHFDDDLEDSLEEDVFGVHGFALFKRYPFELSVTLPGEIVASNADTREGNRLSWEFDGDRFMLAPLTLEARSRVVHPRRIVFGAIGLVLLTLAAIALGAGRRRR